MAENFSAFKRSASSSEKQEDQVLGVRANLFGKIKAPALLNKKEVKTEPKTPVKTEPKIENKVEPKVELKQEPKIKNFIGSEIKANQNKNQKNNYFKNRNTNQKRQPDTKQTDVKEQNAKPQNVRPQNVRPQNAKPAQNKPVEKTEISPVSNENKQKRYNKNNYNNRRRNNQNKIVNKPSVKIYFLGGLNQIGKNFTVFEYEDEMIIVDCGLSFPDDSMLGIDIVIPDFTFIEKNAEKIKGIVITHGHEDHIGALPYLFKKIKAPIYGTPLTMGLLEVKLKEHNLVDVVNRNPVKSGSIIKLGKFEIETIRVNHSISDAVALAIKTPAGIIVHTGDFKIDFTPPEGEMIDLAKFAELGKQGVLALMADSTNAERSGYTMTERKVSDTLEMLFNKAGDRRIVVATFASNISRVQQIINCAVKNKRKVALSGRSMLNVVTVANELGYLNIPEGVLIELNQLSKYEKSQIVLITTGSQGEPMAALSRMAFAEHRQVEVDENDFIIISARPIPGNEKTVGTVVDELLKRNCEVVYESMYEVHVSGHACQEELKIIHALTKPKYFIPVHGEQKHLRKHAQLAMDMGMPKENIFIGSVGNGIELNQNFMKQTPDVPAGDILVDGIGVGDVGSIVLRDRKHLGEDGLIIVVCSVDSATGMLVSGPDLVSRGFVYVRESEELMETARKLALKALERCNEQGIREWGAIKMAVRDALSKYFYEKTRRNPMILPIIMAV